MVLVVGCGLLVAYGEGLHWIMVWNLFPLTLAALAILRPAGGQPSPGAIAFAAVTMLMIASTHAAWVFDWQGTQTGSSTAGLIFLFSPIYSVLLGMVAWAVTRGIGRFRLNTARGAPADAKKRRG
jgi:hypothetical protein